MIRAPNVRRSFIAIYQSALYFALGALLAFTCVWLMMRRVDARELFRSIASAELSWAGGALGAYAAGYALRIERWRAMLACESPRRRWINCAGPLFAGYAANNLLPLRAGDIIRAFAFPSEMGLPPGAVVASLFIERLLDLLSVLCLLGFVAIYFGRSVSVLYGGGLMAVAAVAIVSVLLLSFPKGAANLALSCGRRLHRILPKLADRMQSEIRIALRSLPKLTSRPLALRLLVLSSLIWFFECLIFWFSALAISTSLSSPIASLLAVPVGTLATLVPSTPGFVGTFEYPIVIAMTTLGNDPSAAAAYALLVHALIAVPTVALGTPYLIIHRFHLGERHASP